MNNECTATGTTFEGAGNNCPVCKMFRGVELYPVHYIVPAEGPIRTALGNRMIACDQHMAKLPFSCTGHRGSVACPKCRASKIFLEDERDNVSNDVPCIEQRFPAGTFPGGV